jgi:hypothetical protein
VEKLTIEEIIPSKENTDMAIFKKGAKDDLIEYDILASNDLIFCKRLKDGSMNQSTFLSVILKRH